jgi:hypothetical protein
LISAAALVSIAGRHSGWKSIAQAQQLAREREVGMKVQRFPLLVTLRRRSRPQLGRGAAGCRYVHRHLVAPTFLLRATGDGSEAGDAGPGAGRSDYNNLIGDYTNPI